MNRKVEYSGNVDVFQHKKSLYLLQSVSEKQHLKKRSKIKLFSKEQFVFCLPSNKNNNNNHRE